MESRPLRGDAGPVYSPGGGAGTLSAEIKTHLPSHTRDFHPSYIAMHLDHRNLHQHSCVASNVTDPFSCFSCSQANLQFTTKHDMEMSFA